MPLDDIVFPGTLAILRGLTAADGSPLFHGVSEGQTDSIPQSPWLWVQNSDFQAPAASGGSDLESTTWRMDLRLMWEFAPDQWNAEVQLSALIEPVRQGFRNHIKLLNPTTGVGYPTIRDARISLGVWGYMPVNEVWFRYCDLTLTTVEKRMVTYAV